ATLLRAEVRERRPEVVLEAPRRKRGAIARLNDCGEPPKRVVDEVLLVSVRPRQPGHDAVREIVSSRPIDVLIGRREPANANGICVSFGIVGDLDSAAATVHLRDDVAVFIALDLLDHAKAIVFDPRDFACQPTALDLSEGKSLKRRAIVEDL